MIMNNSSHLSIAVLNCNQTCVYLAEVYSTLVFDLNVTLIFPQLTEEGYLNVSVYHDGYIMSTGRAFFYNIPISQKFIALLLIFNTRR